MNAVDPALQVTRTTCAYCGVGCGILATPDGQGGAIIAGDPDHPANFGRLCSKGSALGETLGLGQRLLHPMLKGPDGALRRAGWDEALDQVAQGLARTIAEHGPNAVAFYLSGQLLTEDYYVANKLMKGFIGSANVDTNSRLCMASSVAGHRRAFGADVVPGCYEDLDAADLIVLVGSNAAWCHPVLFQRMLRNRQQRGARLVVIDPRRTDTAEEADLFLGLAPGSDSALFCGLLVDLADHGALDHRFIADHTTDFAATLARARLIAGSVDQTAAATGLAVEDVAAFFALFRATPRVVTAFSQGVNQSAQGTDKVNAIINCHLATGRIGKPGASPFSLTGQPNAMGGREVGGLANQLAAHMTFAPDDVDRVGRFWQAPAMATAEGHKAVAMFEAIGRGEIKALWVMGTNPVVSLPDADAARAALKKLDLLVVSENVASNDTVNVGVDVLLPAQGWGEKSGTVTNSERRISRQRAFVVLAGEARPDWWIVSEVGKRLGFAEAFDFCSAADVFREHARLSAFENDGRRAFDIGALAALSDAGYDALAPQLWPMPAAGGPAPSRLFGEGGFFTADRKARFVAPEPPRLSEAVSDEFPLRLNTGRIRDQWHTMTRTGLSPRLGQHILEPFVEIHPTDAGRCAIADGGYARIATAQGQCIVRATVTERQQRGAIFAPIHWSAETSSSARVGALVAAKTDPVSGQPENKATPACIAPVAYLNHGFVLSRRPLAFAEGVWWARVAVDEGYGYRLAANGDLDQWSAWLRDATTSADVAEYRDRGRATYRAAAFDAAGALELCVFVGPPAQEVSWDGARRVLSGGVVGDAERRRLLSGRGAEGDSATGPIVCACFGVGRGAICKAIASGAARTAGEVGEQLRAGTNCGSCLPEVKRLIAQTVRTDAAPAVAAKSC
jgi:assimilatory nitrate reductase catalytic subunit